MDAVVATIPELADFEAAAQRIKDKVRRTPLVRARFTQYPAPGNVDLHLKLESLQVTGSFKARGASNAVASLSPEQAECGVITASGGNHGIAVAYAAHAAGVPCVIYLSQNSSPHKADRVRAWGAEVVVEGAVWDDSNRAAMIRAEAEGLTYLHPFADPAVIAGQGTLGLEMLKQTADLDVLLVAIGGGGLISGIAAAAKAVRPEIRIIGIEPTGAPTLKESLAAGEVVTLPRVDTAAATLAPRRSESINLEIIRRHVEEIVLVSDAEMRAAARQLWFDFGVAAELSGAAALAALQQGRVAFGPGTKVAAIICGAGSDGIDG